jgi:hypothetical protein
LFFPREHSPHRGDPFVLARWSAMQEIVYGPKRQRSLLGLTVPVKASRFTLLAAALFAFPLFCSLLLRILAKGVGAAVLAGSHFCIRLHPIYYRPLCHSWQRLQIAGSSDRPTTALTPTSHIAPLTKFRIRLDGPRWQGACCGRARGRLTPWFMAFAGWLWCADGACCQ